MKAKRYLITVACERFTNRNDVPKLTYTKYQTFSGDLAAANQLSFELARDYTRKIERECGPAIGPAQVSIQPVKHKARRAKLISTPAKSDYNWEHTAVAYARWLASRDGIEIPAGFSRATCEWSGVHSATKTNKHGRAVWERRIMAVRFSGHAVTGPRIEIPNWDWQPAEPVETIDETPDLLPVDVPQFVDVGAISEYGMTQRLSTPVRCF